ncbi:nuclear receptor 2C2-associated protein [Daphnia magna]|uniref:nuclear receptor 2C2-associated protein n=1 Tax=Daphnia magna TaxID=35525 RepID=UPI001E1BB4F7|nr:nuclear receptor 2C2-associated protein [Daphnia magna]
MTLIPNSDLTAKVSSVLGREVKSYGKQFLFDGCNETCWNSDQGTPQWIAVQFVKDMAVTHFEIQFQGGFAAKNICLQRMSVDTGVAKVETVKTYYPDDINAIQTFLLPNSPLMTDNLKFLFPESTDMFGRIIVYRLNLYQDS